MITTLVTRERRLADATWRAVAPPPLSATDRLALRIGLALIVWGRRHQSDPALAVSRRLHARACDDRRRLAERELLLQFTRR